MSARGEAKTRVATGRRRTPGGYPLHPFLFALASVLALMANSLNQATFAHVAPALVGVTLFAGALYFGIALLRRRLDARTAVIASIWIVGCLFYSDLFGPLNEQLGGGYSLLPSLPLALAALVLLTALVLRLPVLLVGIVHLVANVVALVLFITPAWEAVAHEWEHGAERQLYDPDRAAALPELQQPEDGFPPAADGAHPDIYHFVFDRFASEAVLAEHYGLDVSETIAFLEERGFHVARDSHSNYHRTAHSLASTFYMDYLAFLAEGQQPAGHNWQPLHRMLGDHRVARLLAAQGYDFIQFGSWWTGTFHNPVAVMNRPHGFSEFNMLYLRRTMLRPIFHALPDRPLTMRLDWDNAQCQRMAPQIEEIKALSQDRAAARPRYVFAHILLPHGPYNFTEDGRCLTQEEARARGPRQGFIDQTLYASRLIEELVNHLQSSEENPPVILIHADEGPFPEGREAGVPWQELSDEQLRIKTAILNAYYFPDGQYRELSDDTSPVNSFRVLFNALFGTNFEILPDRTYVTPDDRHLYDFRDVTERLRPQLELAVPGEQATEERPSGAK